MRTGAGRWLKGLGALMMWLLSSGPLEAQTTVSSSTAQAGWAVNYPAQRKLFRAVELYWAFYADGQDHVFRTSADGQAWSAPQTIRAGYGVGHRIGFWVSGDKVHYAFSSAEWDGDVYYRRGTLQPTGSITWDAAEQLAYSVGATQSTLYPSVIVDSQGAPWVAFVLLVNGYPNQPYDAIVVKSSASDGTWTDAAGFPTVLIDDASAQYPMPIGVPLTGGRTFWAFPGPVLDDVLYGRAWNGTAWEPQEPITVTHCAYALMNLVAEGDTVHLSFGGGIIRYRQRQWDSGWSDETVVSSSPNASGTMGITATGVDSVVVTWLDVNQQLYFREKVAGVWLDQVSWVDESAATLPSLISLNSLVEPGGSSRHASMYVTGASAPYEVRFVSRALTPGESGDDDTSPSGDDDVSPSGDDDVSPPGDDDASPAGDDDGSETGDDDTSPAGDDDASPSETPTQTPIVGGDGCGCSAEQRSSNANGSLLLLGIVAARVERRRGSIRSSRSGLQ